MKEEFASSFVQQKSIKMKYPTKHSIFFATNIWWFGVRSTVGAVCWLERRVRGPSVVCGQRSHGTGSAPSAKAGKGGARFRLSERKDSEVRTASCMLIQAVQ